MKLKYLLSIFGLVTFFAFSQEPKECGTHTLTRLLWDKHPELEQSYYEYQSKIQSMSSPLVTRGDGDEEDDILPDDKVITIPIVFHVLHEYGKENISDAQIYRQMEILNEDFRKRNADTIDIVAEFIDIAADAKIEFKLATQNPQGEPTNGIVRYYTNETNIGDGFSKLSQWPRSRYLNVWVAKSIITSGGSTAGYSNYPSNVEGNLRYLDGVMILNTFVGDIGTGIPHTSRALTHEIGHYLDLPHPWGPTNDPGLPGNCATDDGIEDTPHTIGSLVMVCDLELTTCDTILDNVQNFMDYSYCSNMFTQGQVTRMRNALKLDVSQRSNLWSEANLATAVPEIDGYDPIADFFVDYATNKDRLAVCMGENIKFRNWSNRLSGLETPSYTWTFEDGNVETSTDINPTVSFSSPGWKDVTLTVEDNGRTNTITKKDFIWVAPNWSTYEGTVLLDFESHPDYWIVQNPQNVPYQWEVKEGAGVDGSKGIFLNTTNPYVNPVLFSDEFFFNQRRGGVKSAFISQPINLQYVTGINVSFDFAAATDGTDAEEMKEELIVYTSQDCGATWQLRKKLNGTKLINNGSGWDSFFPNQNTIWTTESFNLPSTIGSHVLFKFEYTGSDKSNNVSIDNIRIDGQLGLENLQEENHFTVFPNPSNKEEGWNIQYEASVWGNASVQLIDMSGRKIVEGKLPANQSEWNIKPSHNTSQGVYILKINNQEKIVQQKLILR